MKNQGKYYKKNIGLIVILLIFLSSSCHLNKYVPENKYLLKNYKIKIDNRTIEKSDIDTYIKQKPNRKVLGVRFHLRVYNMSNAGKNNGFNRWLKKIGEEPVILDEYLVRKTSDQLNLYLKNKGYYHSQIKDTIIYKSGKAKVIYDINTHSPLKINNVKYNIEDIALEEIVISDSLDSYIRRGEILDAELFNKEMSRIERKMNNLGYYEFVKQHITFEADSSIGGNLVDVTIRLKKFIYSDINKQLQQGHHKVFKINSVYVNPYYKPKTLLPQSMQEERETDSVNYDGVNFIFSKGLKFSKGIIAQSIYIQKGEVYNELNVTSTYNHLSSLKLYKLISIEFKKDGIVNYNEPKDTALLNCYIQLSPSQPQSYSFELEGTNSSGNLGGAANIVYQHKNLLKSFEVFDFKITGAFESLTKTNNIGLDNSIEFGTEANLGIQKFWLPFRTEKFIKKYNPETSFSLSYNYHKLPIYSGSIGNLGFGYRWKGNDKTWHRFNPIEINMVNIPFKSDVFKNSIKDTYLEYSYDDHVIASSSYTFTYNNQDIRKKTNSLFLRFNAESAGNILSGINNLYNKSDSLGNYKLFNTEYSQFLKGELDLRYYNVIDEKQNVAYRFFVGLGYPYGNSNQLPFEEKYFSGGANSIRAWKMRTLGPGSYDNTGDLEKSTYPNQSADIKLEANIEYRFKLFWIIEGAFFLDAGNIWIIKEVDAGDDPGSGFNVLDYNKNGLFKWDKFYKDIAMGAGFGARFDFSFFIFRMDIGLKLKDPIKSGNKSPYSNDFNITIGIGYPF